MNQNGFAGPAFTTAARRRRGVPLSFKVEHWTIDDQGVGRPVDVVLMIDPTVDIVRVGITFGAFGRTLKSIQDPDVPEEERMQTIDDETPKVRDALRDCLIPTNRAQFDLVRDAMDIRMLSDVIRWMQRELSGLDPTQPSSSPDGSPTTTDDSADGATLVGSTSS